MRLFQPKRDIKRMLENAGKTLRFSAELVSPMPVDRYRRFDEIDHHHYDCLTNASGSQKNKKYKKKTNKNAKQKLD